MTCVSSETVYPYSMTPACFPLSPTFSIDVSFGGQLQFAASWISPLPL